MDNGEYDDETDAVVSLDADLDLTGCCVDTAIGSVFAADGTLLHYFSGVTVMEMVIRFPI